MPLIELEVRAYIPSLKMIQSSKPKEIDTRNMDYIFME